jgi:23S rRNA (cytosine1962-C5)-methyltransferase
MKDEKFAMFRNRLTKVYRHLVKQAKSQQLSCWRVYDHDLPEFPFSVEFFGAYLYVAEYSRRHGMTDEEHKDWLEKSLEIMSAVLSIPRDHIFLKLRQRKQGRLGQYTRIDETRHELQVEENGLRFVVNLSDYLDTGLFPDHRITRQMVRAESDGKAVINLFAYTGSFSVYAAAGGAKKVLTVDLSNTYLQWARRNMMLNGFSDPVKYEFVQADVKVYLKELPDKCADIIIMDPPTFSNSKRMDSFLDIQKDHVALINDCLRVLKPGGVLYFSTNYKGFVLDKEQLHASIIKDITKATTPFDFQGKLYRWCFRILK